MTHSTVPASTRLESLALRCCDWSERWIPDAYVFAAAAVIIVAIVTMLAGASPIVTAQAFGGGFWSLIPFTMQMSFIIIGGYVVASSPPAARLIGRLAAVPKTARGALCSVALLSMGVSLLHWGLSLILGSLYVRALARREELNMDYRAAAAAGYLGLGSVWAMGLSSSAAQLQANPASMPPGLIEITGVLPFTQTIFLWQSLALTAVLIAVTVAALGLGCQSVPESDAPGGVLSGNEFARNRSARGTMLDNTGTGPGGINSDASASRSSGSSSRRIAST